MLMAHGSKILKLLASLRVDIVIIKLGIILLNLNNTFMTKKGYQIDNLLLGG